MANLLYIEQFDESVTNTPVKAPEPRHRDEAQVAPSPNALYEAFYGGSSINYVAKKVNVLNNRPFSAKEKLLMQIDMMAGNLRLSRSVN